MRIPNPIATTTTEAYLAYKAGVLAETDLKEKLRHPYIHIDGWLAYWTGLTDTYPTDKNGDPECLTDEEAYIAYLAGVTGEYPEALKDPADPRVAGYLKYLISARFGRPNYPVTREELYLSMMKPPVVPSGDPSSSIDLDGTTEAPFVSMEVYGDTEQNQYSGKNLFKLPATSTTLNGVTFTRNADGTFNITGTATSTGTEFFTVVPLSESGIVAGQSYTVSSNKAIGYDENSVCYYVHGSDSAGVWQRTLLPFNGPDHSGNTVTCADIGTSAYIKFTITVRNGETVNLTGVEVQVEQGSTATSYEPYVGGIPSPNPDYPQEVQTVTGRQVVTVSDGGSQSQEYEINLGDIELCKIGDYQDYIYKDGQDWYVHKETDSVSLAVADMNNGEDYPGWKGLDKLITQFGLSANEPFARRSSFYMNIIGFVEENPDAPASESGVALNTYAGNRGLFYLYKSYFGLTQSQWIANYPELVFKMYYGLPEASSTDTQITNSALIAQLDALMEGGSYEGETHIRISATDPNLPALLKVEAGKA